MRAEDSEHAKLDHNGISNCHVSCDSVCISFGVPAGDERNTATIDFFLSLLIEIVILFEP